MECRCRGQLLARWSKIYQLGTTFISKEEIRHLAGNNYIHKYHLVFLHPGREDVSLLKFRARVAELGMLRIDQGRGTVDPELSADRANTCLRGSCKAENN